MLRDDIIIRVAIEAHREIQDQSVAQWRPRLFRTKLAQWTPPCEVTNYWLPTSSARTEINSISELWPWVHDCAYEYPWWLSYFSHSQSVPCNWVRSYFNESLCNHWLKEWLVQNLCSIPPPIHILSSNNPAGPDLNQNLNLIARCLSHELTYTSLAPVLSYFLC